MNLDTILNTISSDLEERNIVETIIDTVTGELIENIVPVELTEQQSQILGSDQALVSTLFDAFKSDFEATPEDPTFDTIQPDITYQTVAAVPQDVYNEPVGNEPPLSYRGLYPYVASVRSESGHLREVDDTPGNERLFEYHRSGSYRETNAQGRVVEKCVSDHYRVVMKDDHLYVEGTAELYVKGNIKIICLNDASIDVAGRVEVNAGEDIRLKGRQIFIESTGGDVSIVSAGQINTKSAENTNIFSSSDVAVQSSGILNIQSSEMNVKSTGNFNVDASEISNKASGSFITDSGSDISFKAGSDLFADSGNKIRFQEDLSLSGKDVENIDISNKSKKTGLGNPVARQKASVPSIAEEIVQGLDDDPEQSAAALREAVASNRITQEEADAILNPRVSAAIEIFEGNAVNTKGTLEKAGSIAKLPDSAITGELKISDYFKLCQLTDNRPKAGGHTLVAQNGLTKSQIAANLSALADNVLDPIKVKYGNDVTINSAFRRGVGSSQHLKGQAVDITYKNKSKNVDDMIEIAKWIRDNVPFDQLILEYGNSEIWTHVSFDRTKNVQRGQVLTCRHPFASNVKYENGIIKYAWDN